MSAAPATSRNKVTYISSRVHGLFGASGIQSYVSLMVCKELRNYRGLGVIRTVLDISGRYSVAAIFLANI